MTVFSKNLKRFRIAKNLTQEQAAEALGVSTQTVSRWECNVTLPDVTILPKIAELYCVTIDDLYKDADGERQYMHEAKGKIGQYASNFRISAEGNTKATAFPQKTKDTGAGLNAEVSSPDLLKMVNTKYKFNKNVLEQESRTEQFYFPSTYFESQTANQSYKSIDDKNTHKFDISGKYVIKEKISMMGSYTGSVGNSYNQSQSISNLYRNGEQLSYMQQIRESNSKNDAHEVNLELTKSLKKLGSLQLRVRGEYQKKEGEKEIW